MSASRSFPFSSVLRAARRALLLVLAFVLPPIAVASVTLGARMRDALRPAEVAPAPIAQVVPEIGPRARTAVVVTGNGGAETSDFLIPYEVLAATGELNVFVVAPEHRIVPLANGTSRDGGLDLVPHFSIDEYDEAVGRAPDVIVIPYLPAFAEGGEQRLVPWIREHADAGSLVVSICAGAEVLAATGLVDGARATTHPNFFERLEKSRPQVTWVRDVRYVETERAISGGAIASGMDATLAAVRRLLGRPAADRVAARLGYAHARFLDDPSYDRYAIDPVAVLPAAFRAPRTSAVFLYDGVSELALGSVFDTLSMTGDRFVSVAGDRTGVLSKNGLLFVPRAGLDAAPEVERVIVPGTGAAPRDLSAVKVWAHGRQIELSRIHEGATGFAYDAALRDIARRDGRAVARAAATNLAYPSSHLVLDGPNVSLETAAPPLAVAFSGLALALLASALLRRRWMPRAVSASSPRAVSGSRSPADAPISSRAVWMTSNL